MPSDSIPKLYHVNHVKRLYSVDQNKNFEGQLPKLRYYHHIKKVEPENEVNNNKVVSVKSQPITANSKTNGSTGQMKITGEEKLRIRQGFVELNPHLKPVFLNPLFINCKL